MDHSNHTKSAGLFSTGPLNPVAPPNDSEASPGHSHQLRELVRSWSHLPPGVGLLAGALAQSVGLSTHG